MSMLGYEDTKEINEIFLNQLIEMEGGGKMQAAIVGRISLPECLY